MAPYRNSRTGARSTRTQIDHDIFEGLPVRHWRKKPIKVDTALEKENVDETEPGKLAWKELQMPRDYQLLPQVSQDLLRAARMPQVIKKPAAPLLEDEKEPGEDEDASGDIDNGFVAKRWAVIPKEHEGPEPDFLAKRRKGLPLVHSGNLGPISTSAPMRKTKIRKTDTDGNSTVWEVLVPEGQTLDGEVVAEETSPTQAPAPGTVLEGVGVANAEGLVIAGDHIAPPVHKRRPPPPKRRPKGPGRGRKKKVAFAGADGMPTSIAPNGTTNGTVRTAYGMNVDGDEIRPGRESEAAEDSLMKDEDQDGEEGSDEGSEEDEEGEEGDREEGEVSTSASPSASPAKDLLSNTSEVVSPKEHPSTSQPQMPASASTPIQPVEEPDKQSQLAQVNEEQSIPVGEIADEMLDHPMGQTTPVATEVMDDILDDVPSQGSQLPSEPSATEPLQTTAADRERSQSEIDMNSIAQAEVLTEPTQTPEKPTAMAESDDQPLLEGTATPQAFASRENVEFPPPSEPIASALTMPVETLIEAPTTTIPPVVESVIQDMPADNTETDDLLDAGTALDAAANALEDEAHELESANAVKDGVREVEPAKVLEEGAYGIEPPNVVEEEADEVEPIKVVEDEARQVKSAIQPSVDFDCDPTIDPNKDVTGTALSELDVPPTPSPQMAPQMDDGPTQASDHSRAVPVGGLAELNMPDPPTQYPADIVSLTRATASPKLPTPTQRTPIETRFSRLQPPEGDYVSPKAPTMSPPTPIEENMPGSPLLHQDFHLPPQIDAAQGADTAPVPSMNQIPGTKRLSVGAAPDVEPQVNAQIPKEHGPLDGLTQPRLAHSEGGQDSDVSRFSDGEEDLLGSLERSLGYGNG